MKAPHRWIKVRQHTQSWQPFKMAGQVPAGTGDCRLRKPTIPCLFRRSNTSREIRWDRATGERSN